MEANYFTLREIDYFNDKIENILSNTYASQELEKYLRKYNKLLFKVFELWKEADSAEEYDDKFIDLAEEIEEFNTNPFYSLQENKEKLIFVIQECCKILEHIRPVFVEYLLKNCVR